MASSPYKLPSKSSRCASTIDFVPSENVGRLPILTAAIFEAPFFPKYVAA